MEDALKGAYSLCPDITSPYAAFVSQTSKIGFKDPTTFCVFCRYAQNGDRRLVGRVQIRDRVRLVDDLLASVVAEVKALGEVTAGAKDRADEALRRLVLVDFYGNECKDSTAEFDRIWHVMNRHLDKIDLFKFLIRGDLPNLWLQVFPRDPEVVRERLAQRAREAAWLT